jgi:hypothetical protein
MKDILDRFIDWVNQHGGPTPVAVAIGKSPQSFYNYTNRGSKPNMEIFALLANVFEDFDPSYILTGKVRVSADSEELMRLRQELEREKAIVTKLVGKFKGAIISLDKGRGIRKQETKAMLFNSRRTGRKGKSKTLSVRVQGAVIPSILNNLN